MLLEKLSKLAHNMTLVHNTHVRLDVYVQQKKMTNLHKSFRNYCQFPFFNCFKSFLGKRLHSYKPLLTNKWLYHLIVKRRKPPDGRNKYKSVAEY